MNAATPPAFWASAATCKESVVLPDASGPYISITLPLGTPPIPNARSIDNAPVDIAGIFLILSAPSFINEPSPNCFSICSKTVSSFFALSLSIFFSFLTIINIY